MSDDTIRGFVTVWVPDQEGVYWQVSLPIGYHKETLRLTLSAVAKKAKETGYLSQAPALVKAENAPRRSAPINRAMPVAQAIPQAVEASQLCPIHGVLLKKSGYSPPKGATAAYYCPHEVAPGQRCNVRMYINRDGSTSLVQVEQS